MVFVETTSHPMGEGEPDLGLKIGEKKFDEIDPEELEALELTDSERCVPKVVHGGPGGFVNFHLFIFSRLFVPKLFFD